MIEIVSDQFLNGKFRVDEKCRQYKSPHCIERRIAVSASVEENATGSVLLEEPESLLGYLQYGERCQIVIEVVDVIPYINVLRNFLPLIQLFINFFSCAFLPSIRRSGKSMALTMIPALDGNCLSVTCLVLR